MSETTLRDNFWIWGHDAGCHHASAANPDNIYRLPGRNRMGPLEGARYLGIPNCCRVVFRGSPEPPFDAESERLRPFKRVIWSVLGDASSRRNDDGGDDLDEVLRQAEHCPNVTGGVLDDFFRAATRDARMTPEHLKNVRDRLHAAPRPLELWLVYYAALLDIDYDEYLKLCDVITFWSWNSAQLADVEHNFAHFIKLTPDKKRYAGCYLYNYGDIRPVTQEEMEFQLEFYRKLFHERKINGVIVCSNTVADIGLDAPEYLKSWLAEHGDETPDS